MISPRNLKVELSTVRRAVDPMTDDGYVLQTQLTLSGFIEGKAELESLIELLKHMAPVMAHTTPVD